jgi:hypothetical protein
MRHVRGAVLGLIAGILTATVAWTLVVPVTFPTKGRARITAVVDELGNVLFGSTPGKVEVTNFPTAAPAPPEEIFNFFLANPGVPFSSPVVIATVPTDRQLIITDIEAASANACYPCGICQLTDSTGVRLVWQGGLSTPRSYTSGVRFGPGETVSFSTSPFCGPVTLVYPPVTFMGRLVPAS